MNPIKSLIERIQNTQAPPVNEPRGLAQANVNIGPNRVVVIHRKAWRDEQGKLILDDEGNPIYRPEDVTRWEGYNVTTNAGKNAMRDRLFKSTTTQGVAYYMAVNTSTITPAATNTQLLNELTNNGMQRAAATYAAGATDGNCSLTHTWTAASVRTGISGMALFDASSGPDMYFIATITSTDMQSSDQLIGSWDPISIS